MGWDRLPERTCLRRHLNNTQHSRQGNNCLEHSGGKKYITSSIKPADRHQPTCTIRTLPQKNYMTINLVNQTVN